MNRFADNKTLKSRARGQLAGHYKSSVFVLFFLISFKYLAASITASLINISSIASIIIYGLIVFLIDVLFGIFEVGLAFFFLKVTTGKNCLSTDLFYGFKNNPDTIIKVQFFISFLSNLVLIPYIVFDGLWASSEATFGLAFVAMLIFFLLGVITALYIALVFSIVYYLIVDFPGKTFKWYICNSISYMEGSKFRLLLIHLSFIPLFLMGILSFGIAFLWIAPYYHNTMANFYLDLVKTKQKSP